MPFKRFNCIKRKGKTFNKLTSERASERERVKYWFLSLLRGYVFPGQMYIVWKAVRLIAKNHFSDACSSSRIISQVCHGFHLYRYDGNRIGFVLCLDVFCPVWICWEHYPQFVCWIQKKRGDPGSAPKLRLLFCVSWQHKNAQLTHTSGKMLYFGVALV